MTLFLMASGVTFVIIIGGIDLSIQAVASMASCILAAYLAALRVSATIPLAVLGGAVAGFAGSIVSTKLRIPSFIATLAVSGVVLSAGYWFSGTRSINISGRSFGQLSRSGRSATRWAFPTRSGSAQSCWSC